MESSERLRQVFIVTSEASKTSSPCETTLDAPMPGQQHEATFGFGMFDDLKRNAGVLYDLLSCFFGMTFIDKGGICALAGQFLCRSSQLPDVRTILLVGRRHMQREQLPRRVDRQLCRRTFATLRAVSGACNRIQRRLQGAAIQGYGARLDFAPIVYVQQSPQVAHDRLETPRAHPALRQLVERFSRAQVVRQHTPRRTTPDQPAHRESYRDAVRCLLAPVPDGVQRTAILRCLHRSDMAYGNSSPHVVSTGRKFITRSI